MLKIEHVIVGGEVKSTPKEKKAETLVGPVQSYQHESLQCFLCFITFCNAKAKERHMRKSHRELYKMQLQGTDTLFSCYQCEKSFSSSELLSQHQVIHNTEEKPFRCTYCQRNFPTYAEVNKHRRVDCIERRFPCGECGALFPSTSRLRHHRLTAHSQGSEVADDVHTYQCAKCSRGFQTEKELLQHQEMFANRIRCGIKPPGKKRGRKPKNAAQGELVDNKKIKPGDDSGEAHNDSTTEETLSNELQTELKIPCPESDCDLTFPSVTALRAHKREDHKQASHKPYSCLECNESYAEPEQLKAHMSQAHCSEYTCPTCGKSLETEGDLQIHQYTHSEGEEAAEKR
ncbi:zinc finger protein 814-like [Cheilinus undulatus]|uniref:zinc finger protein 814-like n=1 Tax=Cheilinus undulatus TaxID=241271 RepID=UPI001BD49D01|nr:zinc finger protein 814-like [Cheilinus undulatus]XP_041665191.1 zinc finger protein 814-like [Cheilinus undulatus]